MRQRVLEFLAKRPEGATDAEIAEALGTGRVEEAEAACRMLADDGLVSRRGVGQAFVNLLSGECPAPEL